MSVSVRSSNFIRDWPIGASLTQWERVEKKATISIVCKNKLEEKKEDLYLYVCVYVMKDDDGNVLNDPMKAKVDSICQW